MYARSFGGRDPDPVPATLASEEPALGVPTCAANPEDSSLASASEPELRARLQAGSGSR